MSRWRPTRLAGHASATPPPAACLIAVGPGLGVASIAKPAILLDRYGDHGCGTDHQHPRHPTTIRFVIYRPPVMLSCDCACKRASKSLALADPPRTPSRRQTSRSDPLVPLVRPTIEMGAPTDSEGRSHPPHPPWSQHCTGSEQPGTVGTRNATPRVSAGTHHPDQPKPLMWGRRQPRHRLREPDSRHADAINVRGPTTIDRQQV